MNKERRNLLVFGYGLTIILCVISTQHGWKHGFKPINGVLIAVAAAFFLLTLFKEDWLKVIYKYWMKVAHFIGTVVSTVIMAVIFYVLFAPVGIILRILKKDLLEEKLDAEAPSYWHKRPDVPFEQKDYHRQF